MTSISVNNSVVQLQHADIEPCVIGLLVTANRLNRPEAELVTSAFLSALNRKQSPEVAVLSALTTLAINSNDPITQHLARN